MVFRSTSQLLHEADRVSGSKGKYTQLRECPVGKILRDAPYIYDAIGAASYAEVGAFNPSIQGPWFQSVINIVTAERARLREVSTNKQKAQSDAAQGRRVIAGA